MIFLGNGIFVYILGTVDKRNYLTNWKKTIQAAAKDDPIIQKVRQGELLTEEEENILAERLNRPDMYFNEENLRRAYRQPGGNLIDFIRAALGKLKIKDREEELTENFQAWLVSKSLTPQQAQYLSILKNRGIARGKIDLEDLFLPRFLSSTRQNWEWNFSERRV